MLDNVEKRFEPYIYIYIYIYKLVSDVSVQPMGPVFKDQTVQEVFSYCQSTLHTIPKAQISTLSGSTAML